MVIRLTVAFAYCAKYLRLSFPLENTVVLIEEFCFDDSSFDDSVHLFKRGSSCRSAIGRNRKALFAQAHIRSVWDEAEVLPRHPHATPPLIKERPAIAREMYVHEEGKDTESP